MGSKNHLHAPNFLFSSPTRTFPSLSSASSSSSAGSGSSSSLLPPNIFATPASSLLDHQCLTNFPTYNVSMQQQQDLLPHDFDWVALLSGLNSIAGSAGISDTAATGYSLRTNGMSLACWNVDSDDTTEIDIDDGSKKRKKASRPRFEFRTRSVDDVLDDGFRWRKYGQKAVKNTAHPRSYYRCTHSTCNVKKQVQRLSQDPSIVVTTYEGVHNHPCEKLMETLAPLIKQMQFLPRL